MNMIKRFIIKLLAKRHYEKIGSHAWTHIEDVLTRAVKIKGKALADHEYAAILFHDSSLKTGNRETHAADSSMIANRELRWFFDKRKLGLIVDAIARHRASYRGMRCTFLDDLLAAADRDAPHLERIVKRLYQFRIEGGWKESDIPDDIVRHLKDKYSRNGYAFKNIPRMYLDTYRHLLYTMWDQIDRIDRIMISKMIADCECRPFLATVRPGDPTLPSQIEILEPAESNLKEGDCISTAEAKKLDVRYVKIA